MNHLLLPVATRLPRALLLFALIGFWSAQVWAKEPGTKKLIYYGWGTPDTQYVRDHWRQIEEMPFDGVGITVAVDHQAWRQGKNGTDNQLGWQVMGRRSFQVEEFRKAITDLQVAQWRTCAENFLPVAFSASQSASGLNWFDDERWRTIANNFAVLARIGAEGNLKGLILDPEHYNYELFNYADQRRQNDKPFEEYVEMARRRGRDIMTAIASAMPRPVLLSLYGHTLPLKYLRDGKSLRDVDYGLLPAFYDGLLEVMPAGAYLVDGYEFAYPFKERRQFVDAYQRIYQTARTLSTVPDRYREKVRAGFGLWLDCYGKPDYFTPQEFRQAVRAAVEVSDGYVWIYSQGPRFFPPSAVAASYIKALTAARPTVTTGP